MQSLKGRVALVTGASRGVGKGIAIGLGEAGATVYLTGRTLEPGSSPGGLGDTLLMIPVLRIILCFSLIQNL